jgi:Ca2+-binding RTX toxin-like protein
MSDDIRHYSDYILSVAAKFSLTNEDVFERLGLSKYGVSASIIDGPILQEYADRNSSYLDLIKQSGADFWSRNSNTDQVAIRSSYEYLRDHPSIRNSVTDYQKISQYQVMIDLGVGNVQLYTAIGLLDDYNKKYVDSDPLNIKKYNGDYHKLAVDLINADDAATSKFAGLKIAEGLEWFQNHAANWNELNADEKEALLSYYYRANKDDIVAKYNSDPDNYRPSVENTPIAQEYLANKSGMQDAETTKNMFYQGVKTLIHNSWCFAAGTPVLTPEGERPIEAICVGDEVLAFDPAHGVAGILQPRRVVRVFQTPAKEIFNLGGVHVTAGHKFFTSHGIFKPINEFTASDYLVGKNGEFSIFPGLIKVDGHHKVYNFEVDDLHTYVAGGWRVHNEGCLQDGDKVTDIRLDDQGNLVITAHNENSTADIVIREKQTLSGNIILERDEHYTSSDANVVKIYTNFDDQKNPVGDPNVSIRFNSGPDIDAQQVGSIFGSQLGHLIAGNNVLAQVGAATVGSLLGAELFQFGANIGHSLLGEEINAHALNGESQLAFITRHAFDDISGKSFATELGTQSAMALSSLLYAEFAEAVGLKGFEGQVFTQTGASLTAQIIKNIKAPSFDITKPEGLFTDINPQTILTSIASAGGSIIGSELGHSIANPDSIGAELFAQVGGIYAGAEGAAIGSYLAGAASEEFEAGLLTAVLSDAGLAVGGAGLGTVFGFSLSQLILPGIGALLGATLGQVVGNAVFKVLDGITGGFFSRVFGHMFGGNPHPDYAQDIGYDAVTGQFAIGETYHGKHVTTEMVQVVSQMSNAYIETVNSVASAIGGHVRYSPSHPDSAYQGRQIYQVVDGANPAYTSNVFFELNTRGGGLFEHLIAGNAPDSIVFLSSVGNDVAKFIRTAVDFQLRHIVIDGGDTIKYTALRAWQQQVSGTPVNGDKLSLLLANMQVASDYEYYLQHTAEINTLMAAAPNSPFTLGWIATLLQAEALGLNKDMSIAYGDGHDAAPTEGADNVTTGDGNDYVFTSAGNDTIHTYGGNDTVFGVADNDSIDGGAGNDELHGGAGDDSVVGGDGDDTVTGETGNDVLTGGAGDDYLIGAAGADSISGNDGNDTVSGGDDNDSIDGGAGNDSLYGDAGNDVLAGGDGADFLSGGTGADSLHGDAGNDNISGGDGNDSIDGGAGNDTLYGDTGDDTVMGGDGNDTLYGSEGNDLVLGGAGNDLILGEAGNDTLWGEGGDDFLLGNGGTDWLSGGDGNDTLSDEGGASTMNGGNGADQISSWGDNNSISGAAGNDTVLSAGMHDTIDGSDGNDVIYGQGTLYGGSGNDFIHAMAGSMVDGGTGTDVAAFDGRSTDYAILTHGSDLLVVLKGSDLTHAVTLTNVEELSFADFQIDVSDIGVGNIVSGTSADDSLSGNPFADSIDGAAGDDLMYGNAGDDTLNGGVGNDTLRGGGGDDRLYGGVGNDDLFGGGGNDTLQGHGTLSGGNGNDLLTAAPGSVTDGGDGVDFAVFAGNSTAFAVLSHGADLLVMAKGSDLAHAVVVTNVEELRFDDLQMNVGDIGIGTIMSGNDNDEVLVGNAFADMIEGGAGDDYLSGLGNDDTLSGGDGMDTLSGGVGRDNLDGGNGNDLLWGDDGNDTLNGGAGNDTVSGGAGADLMTGGAGADAFFLGSVTSGADTIQDFQHGSDYIGLTGAEFGFGAGHLLTAAEFTAGPMAVGMSAQFVYNAANNTLYYDHDGAGGDAAVAIATFSGVVTVTASDIHFE